MLDFFKNFKTTKTRQQFCFVFMTMSMKFFNDQSRLIFLSWK